MIDLFKKKLSLAILVVFFILLHHQLLGQAEVRVKSGNTCEGKRVVFELFDTQAGANAVATSWTVHGYDYEIEGGTGTEHEIAVIWNSAQSNAGVTAQFICCDGNYSSPTSKWVNITDPTKTATVSVSAVQPVVCENEAIDFQTSTNSTSVYYQYIVDDRFRAGGNIPYFSMENLAPGNHTVYVKMLSTECVTNSQSTAISSPITVTVKPFVQTPSTPVGPDTYCIGSGLNSTYTTSAIGADSFNWTVNPTVAGTATVIGHGRASIDWNDSFTNQTVEILVSAVGCNGTSASTKKLVQMSNRLHAPSIPEGIVRRCQGSTSDIYVSLAGNVETYNWTIQPPTAGNVTSITKVINGNLASEATVNWNASHFGQARLTVTATGCGMESLTSFTDITTIETAGTPFPGVPETPNGLLSRCQGSGSTQYSTSATNADTYSWSISPTNAGTISNPMSQSIVVTWNSLFSGTASISVYASNCRGTSDPSVVDINVTPFVGQPSVPDGLLFNPAGSTSQYTARAEFAESYSWWVFPASAGTATPDGTITWSENYVGEAQVTVRAHGCNESVSSNYINVHVYDKSFYRETTVLIPGQTEPEQLLNLGAYGRNVTTTYHDGLGRPEQVVSRWASAHGKDLIKSIRYDELGRESMDYLPYVSEDDNGKYRPNVLGEGEGGYLGSEHHQFYNEQNAEIARSEHPFALTVFEPSPLNRPFKTGAPGTAWQPISDPGDWSDKTIKKAYGSNTDNDVLLFSYDSQTGQLSVSDNMGLIYYEPAELYANKTYNEENHGVIEYIDKEGRTVCKKVEYKEEAGVKSYASTYYIYDDFGNLIMVLSPEAVEEILSQQ